MLVVVRSLADASGYQERLILFHENASQQGLIGAV